ncbi:MAG: hypothetical protein EAY70_04865 [Sphingomonadales bacterium]|nr:MAG: hypothetical protein EAY70_04865 [Sphingomonadales bacterium]
MPMFQRKAFGRKIAEPAARPAPVAAAMPRSVPDADGKLRAIPKAIFDGPQGQFLKELGFSADDPSNIIPQAEDFDRMIKQSLARQEERRCRLEAELLQTYGHNSLRPYFICGEGVLNTPFGDWLIRSMQLMPYDEWNTIYLPTDAPTAAVMRLPQHPLASLTPLDELIHKNLAPIREKVLVARAQTMEAMERVEGGYDPDLAARFLAYVDKERENIVAYVERIKPLVIDLLADLEAKRG